MYELSPYTSEKSYFAKCKATQTWVRSFDRETGDWHSILSSPLAKSAPSEGSRACFRFPCGHVHANLSRKMSYMVRFYTHRSGSSNARTFGQFCKHEVHAMSTETPSTYLGEPLSHCSRALALRSASFFPSCTASPFFVAATVDCHTCTFHRARLTTSLSHAHVFVGLLPVSSFDVCGTCLLHGRREMVVQAPWWCLDETLSTQRNRGSFWFRPDGNQDVFGFEKETIEGQTEERVR